MASTWRFPAPLVRSNARLVFANGIDRQSTGFAPAQQRRCVVVAANRTPAKLPKEPTTKRRKRGIDIFGNFHPNPDYNKWEDPDFVSLQIAVAIYPLCIVATLVWLGHWQLAVAFAIVIAPLVYFQDP